MRPDEIQCPRCGKPAGEECRSLRAHSSRVHFAGLGLDVLRQHCRRCGAESGEVCRALWHEGPRVPQEPVRRADWPHTVRVDDAASSGR